MALFTCEHCNTVMREENYEQHQSAQHPHWATTMNAQLERIARALEGLERREKNRG